MKNILALAILAAALGFGYYTYSMKTDSGAMDTGTLPSVSEHAERPAHYAAKKIDTPMSAIAFLQASDEALGLILKADTLSDTNFEAIHERSYTMEAAVDKLVDEKIGSSDVLSVLNEAVQAIHYASEKHEEAKLREWAISFSEAVSNVDVISMNDQDHEDGVYEIIIENHVFTPDEIIVPAGKKLKLVVKNMDSTPEEFESDDFKREKIIPGNSEGTIFVGPLKPGKYHYFGEFNLDTASGYIIAE